MEKRNGFFTLRLWGLGSVWGKFRSVLGLRLEMMSMVKQIMRLWL